MANNRMTLATTNERIDKLEQMMSKLDSKFDQVMAMMSEKPSNRVSGASAPTVNADKKAEREAKREAEKAEFKKTHKLVRSSKENKQLVYAEMKKQGINEFNRKDYERIAKGLGVLGKNGSVVATWEEIK